MSFQAFNVDELPDENAETSDLTEWVNKLNPEQWKELSGFIKACGKVKKTEQRQSAELGASSSSSQGGEASNADQPNLPGSNLGQAGAVNTGQPSAVVATSSKVPNLPIFNGTFKANDVTYTQWRYAVVSLQKQQTYSDATIMQAVRQSVRGRGFDALYTLGENPTSAKVIEKFDKIFGKVLTPSEAMQDLYSAQQLENESIITWSCRLEGLAIDAVNKEALKEEQKEGVLRTQFWTGLYCDKIKNSIRHKYDAKCSYDDLLSAARIVEKENTTAKATVAAAQMSSGTIQEDKLDIIIKRLERLEATGSAHVNSAQAPQNSSDTQRKQRRVKCFNCQKYGHYKKFCWFNKKGSGNEERPASGGK